MTETLHRETSHREAPRSSAVADILLRIVAKRRERLAEARGDAPAPIVDEVEAPLQTPRDNRFLASLAERTGRAVIAEVKMGSPSLGSLEGRFDPEAQAKLYAEGGAAALSVVVEPDHFHGGYDLLKRCVAASGLPAIAKDFVVDPLQLEWAKEAGASAVLLIAALLEVEELRAYASHARRLGMVPLIETHNLADVRKLAGARWELVGVNNRDLRRFVTELSTSRALAPSLPTSALRVSESGIGKAEDLAMLRHMGYQAFLIGEALLTADDPAAKLRELIS